MRMDYMSKQVEGLHKKYQTIASEISTFMVEQGQWGSYTEDNTEIDLPTHLLSEAEGEEQLTGFPMPIKCCSQMEKLFNSKEDLKPSRVGGLVRVWRVGGLVRMWPRHFRQFCHFRTSMSDEEVRAA